MGFLTPPSNARTCSSDRTSGSRSCLGGRILFFETAPSRSPSTLRRQPDGSKTQLCLNRHAFFPGSPARAEPTLVRSLFYVTVTAFTLDKPGSENKKSPPPVFGLKCGTFEKSAHGSIAPRP